jgi:drug/metabolite transporter (DMT)-like permease
VKNLSSFILLLGLTLCWSPSFLFIKLALSDFYPLAIVWLRVTLAGLLLLGFLKWQGTSIKKSCSYWKEFFTIGFFANALPFILITLSQKHLSISLAAIFNSTTPLSTLLLAHFLVKEEPLTINKIVGVFLGVFGIVAIFYPSLSQGHLIFNAWAAMGILAASISYGIGLILSKKAYSEHGIEITKVLPAGQLLASSVMVLPVFLVFEPGFYRELHMQSILSLAGLVILGSAAAFVIYQNLIRIAGASFASFSTLLFPVFGILLGRFFLKEEIHLHAIIGSALIFLGLFVSNMPPLRRAYGK